MTGLPPLAASRAVTHASLAVHKGMGTEWAGILIRLGVTGIEDLSSRDPSVLADRLRRACSREGIDPPPSVIVTVSIRKAAGSGGEPAR